MTALVWLDREPRTAWQQMAIDLALVGQAESAGVPILRLYRWERDSLSLGANEAALRTWDRAALQRDAVPCVRRPSGGRGVWHATGDLTYAWAGPSGGPAGVRHRYRDLHDRIGAAMARCGVATTLAGTPDRLPGLQPGACFDVAVGGEVLVAGRKRVGSAQKVLGAMLLQHGAIALGTDDAGARYRRVAASAAHSSQEEPVLNPDQVARAICRHWTETGAVPVSPAVAAAIVATSRAHEARFRDPAWTWRR